MALAELNFFFLLSWDEHVCDGAFAGGEGHAHIR